MGGSASGRRTYVFGPYHLDSHERLLLRNGCRVALRPKEFEILTVLLEAAGHLVTKSELMKHGWPEVVVCDGTLNQNIYMLRKTLGGTPVEPHYIETVEKFGYRLTGPIEIVTPEDASVLERRGHASGPVTEQPFVGSQQAYLLGKSLLSTGTFNALQGALSCFEHALGIEPDYALAYVGLAEAHQMLAYWSSLPNVYHYESSAAAARRAIKLDPTIGQSHTWLAIAKWSHYLPGAEEEHQRAIAIAPGDATTHRAYGYFLYCSGRPEESLTEFRKAEELEPASDVTSADTGWAYYCGRRYEDALRMFHESLLSQPNYIRALYGVGCCYEQKGAYDSAIATYKKISEIFPRSRVVAAARGIAHAHSGDVVRARRILENLVNMQASPYLIATLRSALGDSDRALACLEEAYAAHDPKLIATIRYDPRLDSVRSKRRFKEVLGKVKEVCSAT